MTTTTTSHLQSLVAKAHRYAQEPDRFKVLSQRPFAVEVRGVNSTHRAEIRDGYLECDCDTYKRENTCAHVLAAERLFPSRVPFGSVRWPLPVLC